MARYTDWPDPGHIPSDSLLLFGADPCHSPAKESQSRSSCRVCGGEFLTTGGETIPKVGRANDPVTVYSCHVSEYASARKGNTAGANRATPMATVCGGCNRSAYDGTKAMERAHKPALEDETPDPSPERSDPANRTAVAVGDDRGRGASPGGLKGGLGGKWAGKG